MLDPASVDEEIRLELPVTLWKDLSPDTQDLLKDHVTEVADCSYWEGELSKCQSDLAECCGD